MSKSSFNFNLAYDTDTTVTRTIKQNGEPLNLTAGPVVLYIDESEQGNPIFNIGGTISGSGNNIVSFVFDAANLFLDDILRYRIIWEVAGNPQELSTGLIYVTSDPTPYASKIKFIHDLVNSYIDKGLTGYIAPDRIDNAVHAVSLDMYREYYDEYAKTQKLSDYMQCFQSPVDIDLTSGKAAVPIDNGHIIMVEASGYNVDVLEKSQWLHRKNHPIKVPDAEHPIGTVNNNYIEVLPATTTTVTVTYLRGPSKPVYGWKIVSGQLQFDNSESFDIEWPEVLLDVIADRTLSKLGIKLRDESIIRDSQIENSTKTQ